MWLAALNMSGFSYQTDEMIFPIGVHILESRVAQNLVSFHLILLGWYPVTSPTFSPTIVGPVISSCNWGCTISHSLMFNNLLTHMANQIFGETNFHFCRISSLPSLWVKSSHFLPWKIAGFLSFHPDGSDLFR